MKLFLVVLFLSAAACGDDGGNDAGVDGPILRPDGDNDTDLDGIKNDVDNCPEVTNGSQANEDGDRFGDACDPCPVVADDNPADGDGDRVADACDPLPIMFGDRIAFFEGFAGGLPSGWDSAGTWSTAGGNLVGAAAEDATNHLALIVTDRTRETVTASITVQSVTGSTAQIGVLDNKLGNAESAVACVVTGDGNVSVFETTNTAGAVTSAYELTAGQTYIVKLRRDNSTYTCTATRGTAAASATKPITLNNAPYLSGLTVRGASVQINWFLVVESL